MTSNSISQPGPESLLSDRDVERLIGRARSTLQKDRVTGTGIPFVRVGRLVRYRESDVAAFLAALPRPAFHLRGDLTGGYDLK